MAWLGLVFLGLTAEMAAIVVLARGVTHRYESQLGAVRPHASTRRRAPVPFRVHPREPAPTERMGPVRSGRAD
jgi:hypothetical protein